MASPSSSLLQRPAAAPPSNTVRASTTGHHSRAGGVAARHTLRVMPCAARRWTVIGRCRGGATSRRRRERRMPDTSDEPAARLTDAQVGEVLALARDADSVELKMTVPDSYRRQAAASLGVDPLDAQIRQVFFFDTPDLALNAVGVVARARRIQGRAGDTVVKLRPVEPESLPAELRLSPNVGVEVDAMPGGYVCSASLKAKAEAPSVRAVALGEAPIRRIFSKEQRGFFTAHAPEGMKMKVLSILGPI